MNDIRIGGFQPPIRTVARRLWGAAVRGRERLEHALQWENDLARAWRECDRLDLLLPLAIVRGDVSLLRITRVARTWLQRAIALHEEHEPLRWPETDRELLERVLEEACAPDIDVALLEELRIRAIERAGARAPGGHRWALLTAAASVGGIGRRRVGLVLGAAGEAEQVGALIWVALDTRSDGVGDLFAPHIDRDAFVRECLEFARAELELEEAAE